MIRKIGMVLLVAGTVVASLGGAKLPTASVPVSAAGLGLLLAALVCLRWKRPAERSGGAESPQGAVLARLSELPARVAHLHAEARELALPGILERLDALDAELVGPIADGSSSLLSELGATRFADVFGAFAGAERALARAWSAAADGHRPETEAALGRALERARDAARALPAAS